jgi:hypothetical protein
MSGFALVDVWFCSLVLLFSHHRCQSDRAALGKFGGCLVLIQMSGFDPLSMDHRKTSRAKQDAQNVRLIVITPRRIVLEPLEEAATRAKR